MLVETKNRKKNVLILACALGAVGSGVVFADLYHKTAMDKINEEYELAVKKQEIARVIADTERIIAVGKADASKIERRAKHRFLGFF